MQAFLDLVPIALVLVVLGFAAAAPRGLPDYAVALPAAALVVALGLLSPAATADALAELAPTLGFLAAILVLTHLAAALGVFSWLSAALARRAGGGPRRLLAGFFVGAALTTALLSLDATVVLLTPAMLAIARLRRLPPRPHAYAAGHLANSASLLMPVSNLTNLLAFAATGIGFVHFTAVMAVPWLVVIAVEYAVFLVFFRADLRPPDAAPDPAPEFPTPPPPRLALAILAATLAGFGLSGLVGVAPVWVAVVGAAALAIPAITSGRTHPRRIAVEAAPGFLLFVAALSVLVAAIGAGPLGHRLAELLPQGTSLPELLAVAAIAAILANLVNNLPATLLLLAALGAQPPLGLVLAMLIGVNLGPNLTYIGSLATMLWRRVLRHEGEPVALGDYTRLGLITTPLTVVAATTALWLVLGAAG